MKLKFLKNLYVFFVAAIYLMLGIFLLLKYSLGEEMPSISLYIFAVAVIIYGLFRGYRGYKDYKLSQIQNEDQDSND